MSSLSAVLQTVRDYPPFPLAFIEISPFPLFFFFFFFLFFYFMSSVSILPDQNGANPQVNWL